MKFLKLLFLSTFLFAGVVVSQASASPQSILENITDATQVRYDTKDNTGRNLETLDVVVNPNAQAYDADRYLGVHHVLENGQFNVYLVESSDLINWTHITLLESNASNPTLFVDDSGDVLLGLESHNYPGNHIKLISYQDVNDLKNNIQNQTFDGNRSLSLHAEGTPNFSHVDWTGDLYTSDIKLGHHYYDGGVVDRQATARLNSGVWTQTANTAYDTKISNAIAPLRSGSTPEGNFGSRRNFVFGGGNYQVVEAQLYLHDWGAWRALLYDVDNDILTPLTLTAHFGQTSYGNIFAQTLPAPDGNGDVLFWSSFLFTEGAPLGAGQMVAYKELD